MAPKRRLRAPSPDPPPASAVAAGGATDGRLSRKDARAQKMALKQELQQQRLSLLTDGEEAGRVRRRRGRGGVDEEHIDLADQVAGGLVHEDALDVGVPQVPSPPNLAADAQGGGGPGNGEVLLLGVLADGVQAAHGVGGGGPGIGEVLPQGALADAVEAAHGVGGGVLGNGDVHLLGALVDAVGDAHADGGGGLGNGEVQGALVDAVDDAHADGGGGLGNGGVLLVGALADAVEDAHGDVGGGLGNGGELLLGALGQGAVPPLIEEGGEVQAINNPLVEEEAAEVHDMNNPLVGQEGNGSLIVKVKTNKTSERKSRNMIKAGDYVPILDIENLAVEPRVAALKLLKECEDAVCLATHNVVVQQKIEDVPFIRLSSNPTKRELLRFKEESLAMYLECCPLFISVILKNGARKQVPVTPATPEDVNDGTYHIIALVRADDEAEVHLLIERFSNYMKAVRVVLKGERKEDKPWLILGLLNVLPKIFDPFKNLKCGTGYGAVEKVSLHKQKISEVFDLFISFDVEEPDKIDLTEEQEVLVWTSFVCFCEFLRVAVVEGWVLHGITREMSNPLKMPRGFPSLLRDWKVLCWMIFELYIAILELPMLEALPLSNRAKSPFSSIANLRGKWEKRQKIHENIKFFFEHEKDVKLEWLCGEHINLIRHEEKLCNRVLLRRLGYAGPWLEDIRSYIDGVEEEQLPAFQYFSFEQLRLATLDFADSNIVSELGDNVTNTVYQGMLDSNRCIAVKRFCHSAWPNPNQFKEEAKLVGRLRCKKLANLLGCCCEGDKRLLVAEFMPNDTLAEHLHWREEMNWTMRIRAIYHLAEALEYCHVNGRALYHDLNPYRVLFDNDCNPRLSCFGLMKNCCDGESYRELALTPPEYFKTGCFTPESVIYSFGTVLVNTLIGKHIVLSHALTLIQDHKSDMLVDSCSMGYLSKQQVSELLLLASECLCAEPLERPTIRSIVNALFPLQNIKIPSCKLISEQWFRARKMEQ